MSVERVFQAGRGAYKPILSDAPVLDLEDKSASIFYTPSGRWIDQRFAVLVAIGAGLFLLIAWVLSFLQGPRPLQNLFILLSFTVAGVPALAEVWDKLRRFRIDIDLLMLLGAPLVLFAIGRLRARTRS